MGRLRGARGRRGESGNEEGMVQAREECCDLCCSFICQPSLSDESGSPLRLRFRYTTFPAIIGPIPSRAESGPVRSSLHTAGPIGVRVSTENRVVYERHRH